MQPNTKTQLKKATRELAPVVFPPAAVGLLLGAGTALLTDNVLLVAASIAFFTAFAVVATLWMIVESQPRDLRR
jgi:uncharacterized membrane protein YqaE (UPF0057 family)